MQNKVKQIFKNYSMWGPKVRRCHPFVNLKPLSWAQASVRSAERLGAAKQSPVTTTSWAAKNHHLAKLRNIAVDRFQHLLGKKKTSQQSSQQKIRMRDPTIKKSECHERGENVFVQVHILRCLSCLGLEKMVIQVGNSWDQHLSDQKSPPLALSLVQK